MILYISYFIDLLHIVFILTPIIIFFIPYKYFYITKIIILLLFLTPSHWKLFDNKCILTIISQKLGSIENSKNNNEFTEKYLGYIKKKFRKTFNLQDPENQDLAASKVTFYIWVAIYIILFYYLFYFLKCKKI